MIGILLPYGDNYFSIGIGILSIGLLLHRVTAPKEYSAFIGILLHSVELQLRPHAMKIETKAILYISDN